MTTRAAPQLEILALRSIELTDPVAAGELPFIETVGMPYDAAIVAGVVDDVGDKVVQATIAAAFANARAPA
jgi:hypothetical protein